MKRLSNRIVADAGGQGLTAYASAHPFRAGTLPDLYATDHGPPEPTGLFLGVR
jgi:hypothetical protein